MADDGTIADAAIGLTALGLEGLAADAAAVLVGERPSEDLIAEAGRPRRRRQFPVEDQRGPVDYKRHLADELTRRVLRRALDARRRHRRPGRLTMQVTMTVNGTEVTRDVEPRLLLVHFLRETLGLTGTHWGCDTSNCGTCVVLVDGEPVKSCTALAAMTAGHEVRTVEGMAAGGTLDPVQQGFMEEHGLQCGFCTPGMMLTARALLDRNPHPDETEIREAISGQICRCTGYATIVRSVQWAAAHPAGNDAAARRAAGGAGMTAVEDRRRDQPRHDRRGPADRLRPHPAQGGPAVHPREGPLPRRHRAARDAARRDPARPRWRTPGWCPSTPPRRCAHPKVLAVITGKDLEGLEPGVGADAVGRHQAVLATDKVRFQGQEVAFVVAEDRYSARDALELIDVEYEELPVVIDARRALDPGDAR